jgi:hypothetical protein
MDVHSESSKTGFLCPDAASYSVVLAFPKGQRTLADIVGNLIFRSQQTNTLRLCLDPKNLIACSWLNKYGYDAYVVEIPNATSKIELNCFLRGNVEYELEAQGVPKETSIWLHHRHPSGWDLLPGKVR